MGLRGPQRSPEGRVRDASTVKVDEKLNSEVTMPHGLTRYAQQCWQVAVDYLREDGRLHGNQAVILERWAITNDRAKQVDAVISVEGLMIDNKPHPLLPIAIALAEKIRMMARELGMTPASRLPSMKPAEKPDLAPVSPIAALLKGRERSA